MNFMKKLFLGFFLASIFLSTASAGSFPDVPEDHVNYEAIEYLDDHQIINGYEDGTFGPGNPVNRAEAMKIVAGAFGLDTEQSFEVVFPDVPSSEWFFDYVMAAYDAGIIGGYNDGAFKPGDTVNLAEMLKIIVLASGVDLGKVSSPVFLDVPAEVWYAPHALFAREHNIILPDEFGNLHAANAMTRGDVAELIYRMKTVLENNGAPFPIHTNWDVYESNSLGFSIKYDGNLWDVIENENEVVFFKPDGSQFSYHRLYSNSGLVVATIDKNGDELTKTQYFSNLRNVFAGANFTEFSISGADGLEVLRSALRTVDWYLYLENGMVLAVYTEFGNGTLGYQLRQFIGAMLSTLEITGNVSFVDYSALLSEIFEGVLVEGIGMELLNKLPDKMIIETDAIGVGTGPVDYYYSDDVGYTFKYERTSDAILDTRDGQTTTF